DGEHFFAALPGIAQHRDAAMDPLPRRLLEETFMPDAVGTAYQRERPRHEVRRHPFPNVGVVFREPLFGHAGVGPIDAIGMSQFDAEALAARGFWRRDRPRVFAHYLLRWLVGAQAAERGVAQDVRAGPAAELNFGHQLGLDPAHVAPLIGAQSLFERH